MFIDFCTKRDFPGCRLDFIDGEFAYYCYTPKFTLIANALFLG
jgi:hypothetical protein